MTQEQLILFKRSLNIYNTETEAWTALDNLTHTQGQPVVAFFRRTSNTHGDTALGAIFAIGTANGVGKYKACSSHDDMLAVLQALNTHISEWTAFKDTFDKMFEYDANHKAIKAKLDFYTDSNKNISAGGLGGSGSSSLGALYQLIDVMINSTGDGVEGAAEGSVLAYDATAGKWKAIAQSEILPNMSDYYTKDETDAAINAIPIYSMSELSASEIANLSDGAGVKDAYRLKKGGSNVDDTVIKIYKDSAIKSLELRDNKYLVLTYTDNEGNEQSISKDLSVIVNDNYVDLINNQEIGGIKTFTEKTIFKKDINVFGDAVVGGEVAAIVGDGTPAGVTDYSALTGKPSINGKELTSGENTLEALGIQPKGDYTTASQLATTLDNYASKGVVNAIQALIPATASADNQLADKDFVNSSIATATAEFRGSFTSLDELKATSGNLNDYAFYLHTDDIGNKVVDRYKWTTAGWLYEYTLNNSSFTAEQWAALNSAITATLVQSYNSHLNNSTIHITANERAAWNNKWDYNEETIKAIKVNAAGSADKLTTNAGTSAIPIYFKNGKPAQCIPSDLFSAFDNAYSSTETSLGITIAGHTRMVVVAYSTLSEKANKLATPRTLWGKPFDGSANVSGDLKDVGNITASGKATIQGDIISGGEVVAVVGEGTPAGVTDYSALTGKPSINGVTLVSGNNTLAALGIQAAGDYATNSGVTTLLANYADKTFVSNNYVGKSAFNSHIADTDIHITSAERTAWNAKWDYNEATIKAVKVTSASSADSVAWTGIKDKPTSLKNPYALSFGSKTYDGSAAATITASDLGALTAHQSIYALTLQVNGTSKGVYNPTSAAKTINIAVPTKTSDITNDSGFITGITKSMVEGVLTGDITSHTHTFASLTEKPTTISGYGITDALTTSNYNSYTPTLTGTGASGTWGINISGNAANATIASHLSGWSSSPDNSHPGYGAKVFYSFGIGGAGDTSGYSNGITIGTNPNNQNYGFQIVQNLWDDNLYVRRYNEGWQSWKTVAYIDSNVASATKLQTSGGVICATTDGSGNVTFSNGIYIPTEKAFRMADSSGVYQNAMFVMGSTLNVGYDSPSINIGGGIYINSSGNVLIGTTTDNGSGTKLQVNGAINVPTQYKIGRLDVLRKRTDHLAIGEETAVYASSPTHIYGTDVVLRYSTDRYIGFTLNSSGNVLIGTTTDNGYKLQVNGSERVYGDLIVDGEVSALIA